MSRRSRRKTLSHADLEDFLCDLGEKVDSHVTDSMDSVESVSNVITRLENEHPNKSTLQKISDEQRVRDFCKLFAVKQGQAADARACDYARTLLLDTSYRILPARTMYPETFEHPPESLEAKKSLLLSLKPMISDAEVLRLSDSNKCQDFTRCIVGKCKNKSVAFEYTDIDMESVITPEEYEKRYLLHLSSLRGAANKKHTQTLHSSSSIENSSFSSRGSIVPINAENIDCMNIPIDVEILDMKNIPRNVITGEILVGGSKVFDLKDTKSKDQNGENSLGMRSSGKGSSRKSPSSSATFSKRKARASILLPFFDDLNSPESFSPEVNVKSNSKNVSRRMTLSPAAARSLMMEVIADNAAASYTSELIDPTFSSVPLLAVSTTMTLVSSSPSTQSIGHPTSPLIFALPEEESSQLNCCALKPASADDEKKVSDGVQLAEHNTVTCDEAVSSISIHASDISVISMSQTLVASGNAESTSTSLRTYESHPRTYNAELDALLDSDSDISSSTTSSTLPLSPLRSTSFSSSFSKSPACGDISCTSRSFSDFCDSAHREQPTQHIIPHTEQPTQHIILSQKKRKAEIDLFEEEDSFDMLFSRSGSSAPGGEVLLDGTEEETVFLNDSVSATGGVQDQCNSASMEETRGEKMDEEGLRSRTSISMHSISDATSSTGSDGLLVPNSHSSVSIEVERSGEKLLVRKRLEESSPRIGSAKKSRVEEGEHSVSSEFSAHTDCTDSTISGSIGFSPIRCGSPGITLDEAERRAVCRMSIRQETVKWKYHWEIASYCAAKAAREKNR